MYAAQVFQHNYGNNSDNTLIIFEYPVILTGLLTLSSQEEIFFSQGGVIRYL